MARPDHLKPLFWYTLDAKSGVETEVMEVPGGLVVQVIRGYGNYQKISSHFIRGKDLGHVVDMNEEKLAAIKREELEQDEK